MVSTTLDQNMLIVYKKQIAFSEVHIEAGK